MATDANLRPIITRGLIYGAITGGIYASIGGFALHLLSARFRSWPVPIKGFLCSSIIVSAAMIEQAKRVRQYLFIRAWEKNEYKVNETKFLNQNKND
ncbi:hypothetical protein V1514DRAFT_323563 [Lipomyces japonicus]|uniref:uncharacterized protein n=1 Tax=Lipomyces japonicus TaxID=56871 RepID=UPI0034CDC01A